MIYLPVENTVASIVEGMLPRFSDNNLGLLITVQLDITDYGYGKDGNTLERKQFGIRRYVHLIFTRPSNYTKVFVWIPEGGKTGLDLFPQYAKDIVWDLVCDHDSCWKDGFKQSISDCYNKMIEKFKGRKVSGVEMNPYRDLSTFHIIERDPQYIRLTFEKIDKKADHFSEEGRKYKIDLSPVMFYDLVQIKSPDPKLVGQRGLLLKDSEDYKRLLTYLEKRKKE
jgi:hypothetical protein